MMPTTASLAPAPFFVIAKQRSGSTWLMDLLNSHPEVMGLNELFMYDVYGSMPVLTNDEIPSWCSWSATHPVSGRLEQTRNYFRYLDEVVLRDRDGITAPGVKVMYNQATSALGVIAYIQQRGVRLIHLIRRNHLAAIVSAEAVKARSVAHANTDVAAVRIELEPESLLFRLNQRRGEVQQATAFFQSLGTPYVEVFYEDLLEKPETARVLLPFLGVADSELASGLRKLNPRRVADSLSNADAVGDVLRGTAFADLLT